MLIRRRLAFACLCVLLASIVVMLCLFRVSAARVNRILQCYPTGEEKRDHQLNNEVTRSMLMAARVQRFLRADSSQVNARASKGCTVLMQATFQDDANIVSLFLARGANPNVLSSDGTPLHWAQSTQAANSLIAVGANVNARDNRGTTPLHNAVQSDEGVVAVMIANGAKVNARDDQGNTPLNIAARVADNSVFQKKFAKTARLLVDAGANVNVGDEMGTTPLHNAAKNDDSDAIALLINAGARVDVRDNEGDTPLSLAAQLPNKGFARVAGLLINAGANVDTHDNRGNTPLHHAAAMGFDGDAKEAVVFLISRGADANAAGENGCPPLLYAMSLYCAFADDVGRSDAEAKQQRAIVAALLSAGANVNASSPRTGTAIYMAAFRLGDNELIDMLIKKGAHLKVPG